MVRVVRRSEEGDAVRLDVREALLAFPNGLPFERSTRADEFGEGGLAVHLVAPKLRTAAVDGVHNSLLLGRRPAVERSWIFRPGRGAVGVSHAI